MLLTALLLAAVPTLASPVVGGDRAEDGVWPDCAAIYFGGEVGCTGTLVAPTVVLTAAHCIGGISKVKLGVTDHRDSGEQIRVADEIRYPQHWSSYDIGVLVLEEPAQTEPRLIAQGCILDNHLYDGADVAIVGYGAIDEWGNQYTPYLQEAFTTVSDHDCSDISSGCTAAVSPGGELGAGGSGVDSCYGDSGGPLYLLTDQGDYLVGITSRAYDWVNVPCRDGGIYGRPDAIIDWIEGQTGVEIPSVSCNQPPEPTVKRIVVERGQTVTVSIQPNDPDQGDTHTYYKVEDPDHGRLSLSDDGEVRFKANRKKENIGPDLAVVGVEDDADPPHAVELEIEIEITDRTGCGCAAGPARRPLPWSLALLALLGLGARRRRGIC